MHWVDATKEVPKHDSNILLRDWAGFWDKGYYDLTDEEFYEVGSVFSATVTHWMEIKEPTP